MDNDMVEKVKQMYCDGHSYEYIAKKLNLKLYVVKNMVHIDLRKLGEG